MSNKTMYKLTDENQETLNSTKWELNVWREAPNPDVSAKLCSDAWLHGDLSPELAVLLNPMHANFKAPRLFKAEIEGEVKFDGQLKFGCKRMRIVEEMALPSCTKEQRIRFGILCALECNQTPEFVTWANNWLDGTDRSTKSAKSAKTAYYATCDTYNAAYAAYDAAAYAKWAANAAANAAEAASYATKSNPNIDLVSIAKRALEG